MDAPVQESLNTDLSVEYLAENPLECAVNNHLIHFLLQNTFTRLNFENRHDLTIDIHRQVYWIKEKYDEAALEGLPLYGFLVEKIKEILAKDLEDIAAAPTPQRFAYLKNLSAKMTTLIEGTHQHFDTLCLDYFKVLIRQMYQIEATEVYSRKFTDEELNSWPQAKREEFQDRLIQSNESLKIFIAADPDNFSKYSRHLISLKILMMKIDQFEKSDPKSERDLVSSRFKQIQKPTMISRHFN